MLKRLFLSIIILSALTSEGGNYYTANLIDYYLINLSHFDIAADGRNALSNFGEQNLSDRKGTPAAFFKKLSQDAINARSSNSTDNSFDYSAVINLSAVLVIFIAVLFSLRKQILFARKHTILCRADSSPPLFS